MKLKPFIEQAKLNLRDLYFVCDGGSGYSNKYEIRPEDFITFAKEDFFKADARGLVNALSNAKRAVDWQADGFLKAIGLDPNNLASTVSRLSRLEIHNPTFR